MRTAGDLAENKSMKVQRKSSLASKVLQAAALAAVLVPLGTVAVETTPMSFCGSSASCTPDDTNSWSFGDFTFTLQFFGLEPSANFLVDATATPYDAAAKALRPLPTGFECIPLDLGYPTPQCWEVDITTDQARVWDEWRGTFNWLNPTDGKFPDPRFFHFFGGTYNDITEPGSHNDGTGLFPPGGDPCLYGADCGDPSISGRDNDFSQTIPGGASTVPEPTTLLLLGSGVGTLLYRRRQRRQR
jgi:hypothetical protein